MPGLARVCACPRFPSILARAFIANSCTSSPDAAPAVDSFAPAFAQADHVTGCRAAVIVPLCHGTRRGTPPYLLCSSDDRHRLPFLRPWLLSIWLVVVPPPCRKPCRSLEARLCRVCVHFNKNIYYFGYFIPKNVQNARYFALFSKNIW